MRRRSLLGGLLATAAAPGLSLAAAPGSAAASGAASRSRTEQASAQAGWALSPAPAATPGSRLLSVSAARTNLAWAVGEQGLLPDAPSSPLALRWNGTAWSHTDVTHLGLNGALRSVSGSSASDAWAVGENRDGADRLLRWDGATWRAVTYPGSDDPTTVLTWVASAFDGTAWAAGRHQDRAGLLHWDGHRWAWTAPLPDPAVSTPWRVRPTRSGGVYAVGDTVARWDGDTWTELPPVLGIRLGISDVLVTADDDIWAVGAAFGVGGPPGKPPGVVLRHFDGTEWTAVDNDTLPFSVGSLNAIAGDAEDGPAVIGGWDFWDDSSAHYLRWDGTAWTSERGAANGVDAYVRDVARIPGTANGIWSVGHTMNTPAADTHFRIERYA